MNHLRSHILIAIACLASPLFSESDESIIDELKGVLLVPTQSDVDQNGPESIEGFHSKGMDVPGGDSALDRQLAPNFIGQPLTKESLMELKRSLLRYYRDQGYPVVIVEIPEQNLKSGVVQIGRAHV